MIIQHLSFVLSFSLHALKTSPAILAFPSLVDKSGLYRFDLSPG